jgi:3-oxoacyl-[acyl-carrier-protein] synthase III
MGTRIEEAVAQAGPGHGWRKVTARRLADAAARTCLARAGKEASDVDMLINAGVYREDSMGEPALATLIQEDIGANLGHPGSIGHGTFSFDAANGVTGVLNAIHLQSGLLRSGVIKSGLIVTSDTHPGHEESVSTLFRPIGGALLLGWDDSILGFTDFHFETFPEYEDLLVSGLVWRPRRGVGGPGAPVGQHQMIIDERPGYQARCVDCAEEATRRFLGRLGMRIDEIDLLVPAPAAPDILDPLRIRLGIPGDRVAFTTEDLVDAYSTGPIAALQAAIKSGRLGEARNTLMLAVGAGITVALALYRQVAPEAKPAQEPEASPAHE